MKTLKFQIRTQTNVEFKHVEHTNFTTLLLKTKRFLSLEGHEIIARRWSSADEHINLNTTSENLKNSEIQKYE